MNATQNLIACPKCATKIEVTQAITAQITDRLRKEVEADVGQREEALRTQVEALVKKKAEIERAEKEVSENVRLAVESQRAALLAEAKKKVTEDLAVEMKERDERLNELQVKLKDAQSTELALRKRERDLQEKAENIDLEIQRRIKDETDRARDTARKQADEEHELKEKETQEQITSLRKQIDELKRKAEQGSQQAQGEVLELLIEDVLARTFPHDAVEPIAKGVHGADVLQRVLEPSGLECGSILWETKNARKWSATWLPKLRQDQREAKASLAVLVTEAMPPDVSHFTEMDGVWVCSRACAIGLASALRMGLIELAKNRQASDGKNGKIERVYDYLTSSEFRQRVQGMVEPLIQLQGDLQKERRAMERIWAAREKQIQAAIVNVHGMYGDLQGIVGSTLPALDGMELRQLEAADA